MNTILIVLTYILAFLVWVELEQILTRRFLDKITEDTVKLSEENTGLIVKNIKIKEDYHTLMNKHLTTEKNYLDLLKRQCKTEKNKMEIIRLHKLGRSSEIIAEYVWVTGSAVRSKIREWKKKEPRLFRPHTLEERLHMK